MKIEQMEKPVQNIISITKTLPVAELPNFIGPTFMELAHYISQQNGQIVSTPFVAYHDLLANGETKDGQVTAEIGFPVAELLPETTVIRAYQLPSYLALTVLYVGRYEEVTPVYRQLLNEIKNLGGHYTNKAYEYYLSDEEVPPELQETIIEVPYMK